MLSNLDNQRIIYGDKLPGIPPEASELLRAAFRVETKKERIAAIDAASKEIKQKYPLYYKN